MRSTQNSDMHALKFAMGTLMAQQQKLFGDIAELRNAELSVFSQWGDDEIIQYLIGQLVLREERFIEFGVADYTESNTRFLLLHDNWSGLVMDCSPDNIESIKRDDIYWRYDLTAISAFLTVENVNQAIASAGFSGEVGLLHIDVDGNDYWLWNAINTVSPIIAVIKYNSLFGLERSITTPYDSTFSRFSAHFSGLYAGASLPALCDLAHEKGYSFIGSNSAGNNAYFVRKDRLGILKELSVEHCYVASKFREHRDETGRLTFLSGNRAIETLHGMPIYNTRTGALEEL